MKTPNSSLLTPPSRQRDTLGTQAEFHQTWQALMRQFETPLSIAHRGNPNRTETLEAVSIAKHLLAKVGDQFDKSVQE